MYETIIHFIYIIVVNVFILNNLKLVVKNIILVIKRYLIILLHINSLDECNLYHTHLKHHK